MLDFELCRVLTGQHLMQRRLREAQYRLIPSRDLLEKNIEGWEVEGELTSAIRRAFLLSAEWDSRTGGKTWFDMTAKRTLRQMEVDRWIEGCFYFVRRDSVAGFLYMAYRLDVPRSYKHFSLPDDWEDNAAGDEEHCSHNEQGVNSEGEQPTEDESIGFSVQWLQMGTVSCLCRAAEAGGAVASWQVKVENALRDAGFAVRKVSDWFYRGEVWRGCTSADTRPEAN